MIPISCNNRKRVAEFYEDGQIKRLIKYRYLNDTTNQTITDYFENGEIKCIHNLKNGKPEGEQISYFQNGEVEVRCIIKNGKREGKHVEFFPSGKLAVKGNYYDGLKNGIWEYYNTKGEKFLRPYHKDKLEGLSKEYLIDGTIIFGNYFNDREIGTWTTMTKDSVILKEITYFKGYLHGPFREFYKSGKIYEEGYYLKGKKEGEWMIYNNDGTIKLIETYKNDLLIK